MGSSLVFSLHSTAVPLVETDFCDFSELLDQSNAENKYVKWIGPESKIDYGHVVVVLQSAGDNPCKVPVHFKQV